MNVNQIVVTEKDDFYEIVSIHLESYSYGKIWLLLSHYYDCQKNKILIPKNQFKHFKTSLSPLAITDVNLDVMTINPFNQEELFRFRCANIDRTIKSMLMYFNLLCFQLNDIQNLCSDKELMYRIADENIKLLSHLSKINIMLTKTLKITL